MRTNKLTSLVPFYNSNKTILHGSEECWSCISTRNISQARCLQRRCPKVEISITSSGEIKVSQYVECFRCGQTIYISKRVDGNGWILQDSEYGKLHHCNRKKKSLEKVVKDNARILGF